MSAFNRGLFAFSFNCTVSSRPRHDWRLSVCSVVKGRQQPFHTSACWIRARSALTQETAAPDLSCHGGPEEALLVLISCSRLKPGLRYSACQLAPWSSHKNHSNAADRHQEPEFGAVGRLRKRVPALRVFDRGGTLIGLFWAAGHDTSHEYCL